MRSLPQPAQNALVDGTIAGVPVRREFEYHRIGTAKRFATLYVHEGTVAG